MCGRLSWGGRPMDDFDIRADPNAQDDDGNGWSLLTHAREPSRVRPGAMLLAGDRYAEAVVRIVGVDGDGQVHFDPAGVGCQEPQPARPERGVTLRSLGRRTPRRVNGLVNAPHTYQLLRAPTRRSRRAPESAPDLRYPAFSAPRRP